MPVVCTHTEIDGKLSPEYFLKNRKNTIFNEHPVSIPSPIELLVFKQIYLYDFTNLIMTIFVKKYFQIPGQEERVNETGITLELCLPVSA